MTEPDIEKAERFLAPARINIDPDDEMKEIAFKTKKEEFKDKRRRKKVA